MKFECPQELWRKCHPLLRRLLTDADGHCQKHFGFDLVITSLLRHPIPQQKTLIHSTGRAGDFSISQFGKDQLSELINYIAQRYPRTDGKQTVLVHDAGAGVHGHVQVPWTAGFNSQETYNTREFS